MTDDGKTRMCVAPEGGITPLGWITGRAADNKSNLKEAGRAVMHVVAPKALVAREGFDLTTPKVKDLAAGAYVHVMETRQTSDGAYRVAFAMEGKDVVKGWVTAISKDGALNLNIDIAESRRATPISTGSTTEKEKIQKQEEREGEDEKEDDDTPSVPAASPSLGKTVRSRRGSVTLEQDAPWSATLSADEALQMQPVLAAPLPVAPTNAEAFPTGRSWRAASTGEADHQPAVEELPSTGRSRTCTADEPGSSAPPTRLLTPTATSAAPLARASTELPTARKKPASETSSDTKSSTIAEATEGTPRKKMPQLEQQPGTGTARMELPLAPAAVRSEQAAGTARRSSASGTTPRTPSSTISASSATPRSSSVTPRVSASSASSPAPRPPASNTSAAASRGPTPTTTPRASGVMTPRAPASPLGAVSRLTATTPRASPSKTATLTGSTQGEVLVAMGKLKMRAGRELDSDETGSLPAGTRVVVLERGELVDGTKRTRVAREGDSTPLGWVSSLTKEGRENFESCGAVAPAPPARSSVAVPGSVAAGGSKVPSLHSASAMPFAVLPPTSASSGALTARSTAKAAAAAGAAKAVLKPETVAAAEAAARLAVATQAAAAQAAVHATTRKDRPAGAPAAALVAELSACNIHPSVGSSLTMLSPFHVTGGSALLNAQVPATTIPPRSAPTTPGRSGSSAPTTPGRSGSKSARGGSTFRSR